MSTKWRKYRKTCKQACSYVFVLENYIKARVLMYLLHLMLMYLLHLMLTFTPHYIIMVKGLLELARSYWQVLLVEKACILLSSMPSWALIFFLQFLDSLNVCFSPSLLLPPFPSPPGPGEQPWLCLLLQEWQPAGNRLCHRGGSGRERSLPPHRYQERESVPQLL